MLVYFIKWLHVLSAIALLGMTGYYLILAIVNFKAANFFNCITLLKITPKMLLNLTLFAVLTGTLLIFPKHYSFHTHWIQAAYLLAGVFSLVVWIMSAIKVKSCKIWIAAYFILVIMLVTVVHDAVNKSTFLF